MMAQQSQQTTDGLRQPEVKTMDIWQAYAAAQDEIAALKRERAVIAIMAHVKSIGVHAKHDLKNAYIVSLKFEGDDQPTIAQFEALRTAALAQSPATEATRGVKTVAAYVMDYEFRGDGRDYSPTDDEREIIEDSIEGYLALAGGQHG